MALDIHEPKYGYNYVSTAVYVPAPVVSMITTTQGDTVYALGFYVDSESITNIDIPSAHQFSFLIPNTHSNGAHTLTIVAFDQNYDQYPETFNFTIAGLTQFFRKSDAPPRKEVLLDEERGKPPEHTAEIQDNRQDPNLPAGPEGNVARTITIRITPGKTQPDAKKPRVLVEALFKEAGQEETRSLGSFRFPVQDRPTVFRVIHPKVAGTLFLRVYLWEPETIKEGDKLSDIVTIRHLAYVYVP